MKSTIITVIIAASLMLTGCGKTSNTSAERTNKEVATSQVVAYATTAASTTTNIDLTVTEIWKGVEEASKLGVTNGMRFSQDNPGGRLPEGAILRFSVDTNLQTLTKDVTWVRSGRVVYMYKSIPVQEFKAEIGK
ncbi:MAG: hypothetical protein ACXWDN_15445 [Limisphaerales bacterium]